MLNVSKQYFDKDGNEISYDDWTQHTPEIIRETAEDEVQSMTEIASNMICSTHKQMATLKFILKTDVESPLEVEITGCCDDFTTQVQESL